LLVVGLLVMAIGCARPRVKYEEIFLDDRVHVRLAEKQDKSGAVVPRGFDHPWDVEIGTLDDMLESVHYNLNMQTFVELSAELGSHINFWSIKVLLQISLRRQIRNFHTVKIHKL